MQFEEFKIQKFDPQTSLLCLKKKQTPSTLP